MTQFDIFSNTDEPRDFGMWGKKTQRGRMQTMLSRLQVESEGAWPREK